jgi:hypothetical protein
LQLPVAPPAWVLWLQLKIAIDCNQFRALSRRALEVFLMRWTMTDWPAAPSPHMRIVLVGVHQCNATASSPTNANHHTTSSCVHLLRRWLTLPPQKVQGFLKNPNQWVTCQVKAWSARIVPSLSLSITFWFLGNKTEEEFAVKG